MKTKIQKTLLYLVLIIIFTFTISSWWSDSNYAFTTGQLNDAVLGISRLIAILAAILLPLQLILIGRVKWVETVFGLDKLSRLHRVNGLVILGLILAHPFLTTLSYSIVNQTNFVAQYFGFVTSGYGDILFASFGFAILLGTIVWSLSIVRRKLKYEWWYYVHVFNYLAIALIFLHVHEITENSDSLLWPAFWFGIYGFTALNILWFRFARPTLRFWQHQFTISRVEDLGVATSIYITGRNLEKFKIDAGQFMIFRFLQKEFWTQAHPFSLSWAPITKAFENHELRITVKKLGDFTNELPKLHVGTQVLIDGPHGIFTEKLVSKDKLLFIAGGIGITPIRSILESLGERHPDKILISSNKTRAESVLADELLGLSKLNNFKIINIYADEVVAGAEYGRIDKAALARLIPDIADRDIFLCGPPPMMTALRAAMIDLGVPKSQIHFERFAL